MQEYSGNRTVSVTFELIHLENYIAQTKVPNDREEDMIVVQLEKQSNLRGFRKDTVRDVRYIGCVIYIGRGWGWRYHNKKSYVLGRVRCDRG